MRNLQATGQLYGETITVKQISKIAAKKLFVQGIEVYLQSSNYYPFGIWQSLCPIKLDNDQLKSDIEINQFSIDLYSSQVEKCNNSDENWLKNMQSDYESKLNEYKSKVINAGTQFDSTINNYSYYNCDNERGKYVNFYAKIS